MRTLRLASRAGQVSREKILEVASRDLQTAKEAMKSELPSLF